ncbi:MAG: PilN domain-containing protein, partial [Candidatus Binatia bacterium]
MIRINLLPVKQTQQAERQRQELTRVVVVAVLVVLVAGFYRIYLQRQVSIVEARISEIEEALKALDSKVKDVTDLDQKRKSLDAKLKVIADLGRKRVGPVGVMTDLARATPDRVWLTDSTEVGGSATLTGIAVDNQIVAEFLRNLGNSPYFTTVDLVETTQE